MGSQQCENVGFFRWLRRPKRLGIRCYGHSLSRKKTTTMSAFGLNQTSPISACPSCVRTNDAVHALARSLRGLTETACAHRACDLTDYATRYQVLNDRGISQCRRISQAIELIFGDFT